MSNKIDLALLDSVVTNEFGIDDGDLTSVTKKRYVCTARKMFCMIASLKELDKPIADYLNREIHAVKYLRDQGYALIDYSPPLKNKFLATKEAFENSDVM